MMTVVQLKPGDPPPFWNGPWHPRGEAVGAVFVRNGLVEGAEPVVSPGSYQTRPGHDVGDTEGSTLATRVTSPQPEASETARAPVTQQQPSASALRSWVAQLVSRAVLSRPRTAPLTSDAKKGLILLQQARGHLAQRKWVDALSACQASLECAPAHGETYLLMAQCLNGSRAAHDALHHALLAVMLNPREAQFQRVAIHYAWIAGYVGWTFHWAQQLYRLAPSTDLADLGRLSHGWLTSQASAQTAYCFPCRKPHLSSALVRCGTCDGPLVGAPANSQGLQGLILLQHAAPSGRLFVGCHCQQCLKDSVLIVQPGGARCSSCRELALPARPISVT